VKYVCQGWRGGERGGEGGQTLGKQCKMKVEEDSKRGKMRLKAKQQNLKKKKKNLHREKVRKLFPMSGEPGEVNKRFRN